MKLLVLYQIPDRTVRKTVYDHLYSFQNYLKDTEFHYCNVFKKIPFYLKWIDYDGIILHYTLLSAKWDPEMWQRILPGLSLLKKMNAVKIAFPQDEYVNSELLCKFFKENRIESVFTCAKPCDYQVLYPSKKSGIKHYQTTLTGFVDENTLNTIHEISQEIPKRDIDIGYRARSLPYWLGYFGQLKKKIAEPFLNNNEKLGLIQNISTDDKDVFYGNDWIRFILRCRTMLGCLGGASMHDPNGKIRQDVENYVEKHPHASFDEVEKECFPNQDHTLKLFALSPRHFECAMAKTCQVLLEGEYDGVFQPGIHYIELKRDFSNLNQVVQQIKDTPTCEKIAERAYQDIVLSGNYTYRKFTETVADHVKALSKKKTDGAINQIMFRIVSGMLWVRKPFGPIHRFIMLPHPIYRLFRAVVPKPVRKKLKPLKNLLVNSR